MNNQRIDRIATRKASTEQLAELRRDAKEQYLNLQVSRKKQEIRTDTHIEMSREELLWKEELHRLAASINYRKRTVKLKELKRRYNI